MHGTVVADVVVIGGGIAGLAAAHRAVNAGASVVVLEAAEKIGGVMQTERRDGFLIEQGPTSMSSSAHMLALLNELGLSSQVISPSATAKRRYVVRDGAMHALPSSPPALVRSKLLSARAKLRLLVEPLITRKSPDEDESLASLVKRRLGREVLDYFVDPFVSGVCAGDPARLSKRYTLKMLHEIEQEHGSLILGAIKRAKSRAPNAPSGIVSFRDGMQELPSALSRAITRADDSAIRLSARVTRVMRAENGWHVHYTSDGQTAVIEARAVVCALPGYAMATISWPEQWAEPLSQVSSIRYAPIATVALGFRRDQVRHVLDGFGVLFPSIAQHRILGTLFNSSMFEGRAPDSDCLMTTFVGGTRTTVAPSSTEAVNAALAELTPLLGLHGTPMLARVSRWETGIPQFELGHEKLLLAVANIEAASPESFFTGSHLSGVAIGDCLEHGAATGGRAAAAALRQRGESCNILAQMC